MSVLIFKKLQQLKTKTFGLGKHSIRSSLRRFGFNFNYLTESKQKFNFCLSERVDKLTSHRLVKFLHNTVLVSSLNYNLALVKQINRRIELLRFNRSWKGARHICSLPVRGQRTKTNARTQKSRRKKRV